jgi:hypothetical protein
MDIVPATFKQSEIAEFLVADGFTPGTPEYQTELNRRYRQYECFALGKNDVPLYIERNSWQGDRRKAA